MTESTKQTALDAATERAREALRRAKQSEAVQPKKSCVIVRKSATLYSVRRTA